MESKAAGVTVRLVEPTIDPEVALIVVVPVLALWISPVALTVATLPVVELQVAVLVRSCVVPSLKVPVAVNCCEVPSAIEALPGVTVIEVRTAPVTVKVSVPVTDTKVAEIVTAPWPGRYC
jgi:hypothetical protein